jgi:hypothetical protein
VTRLVKKEFNIQHKKQNTMSLATGEYIIVNKQTGKALDANVDAASHMSNDHKRPFMWDKTPSASNHKWFVEKQYNGSYLLKTRHNNHERALDGNVNVPQKQTSHPQPFLWTPVPSAANHRWILKQVGSEYNTYMIVNEANQLALDGNVNAIGHHDHRYQSPFLWTETYHAPNHHWIFQAVTQPQTTHHVDIQVGNMMADTFNMIGNVMNHAIQQQPSYPTYQVPQQQPSFHQPNVHVHVTPNVPFQQPHIHHQQPPPQQYSSGAMDNNAFQQFLNNLKREGFESGRKNLLSTIASHNWFTCDQLAQIIKILSFSSEKVYAASVIVPRIVDKQNSYVVLSTLTFSSDKNEVTKLFQRY